MTAHIKGFFQALLSTFDSYSDMTWATLNDSMTTAMFPAAGMNVTVRFSPLNASCLVDYHVSDERISTTECVRSSLSVYNGVLQALRIFHRVHGPVAYRFANDDEALAELWEAYRECPRPMGHKTRHTLAH